MANVKVTCNCGAVYEVQDFSGSPVSISFHSSHVRPETLVRWHRAVFRWYWRWKSRQRGGRPQIDTDLRALIRRMSIENPLWGAPRIHGELIKLGFAVAAHNCGGGRGAGVAYAR